MVIDFAEDMVPIGLAVVTILAATAVGIGSCVDDRERKAMRTLAERVGAWWTHDDSARATARRRNVRPPITTDVRPLS